MLKDTWKNISVSLARDEWREGIAKVTLPLLQTWGLCYCVIETQGVWDQRGSVGAVGTKCGGGIAQGSQNMAQDQQVKW